MNTTYLKVPNKISFKDMIKKSSLSALQYKKIFCENNNVKLIKDLIVWKISSWKEVWSDSYTKLNTNYRFIRTKAIQNNNFQLDLNIEGSFEYIKPKDFEKNKWLNSKNTVNNEDLLFVTWWNVWEVVISQEIINSILSSHILKLPIKENKYYVFSFLKNSFCKEQANLWPLWSIAWLDSFTIDTLLNIQIPFPKQENKSDVVKYVELLTQAIIDKEKEIRNKNNKISTLIENELSKNQDIASIKLNSITFEELRKIWRLDTWMYNENYKKFFSLIQNYENWNSTLEDLWYKITRWQNLQVSNIWKSIYSEDQKEWFYKLILSKYFTEFMTYNKCDYLWNYKKLKTIKKWDIIFSCRWDLWRTIVFCEDIENLITNIDNVHIENKKTSIENKIFIWCFLNYLRNIWFLTLVSITWSWADSFTKYHFDLLKFPNFSESKQKEIAKIYYNPTNYPKNLTLYNFFDEDKKWNKKVWIVELDKSIKIMKTHLNSVLDKIINDEFVEISFSF